MTLTIKPNTYYKTRDGRKAYVVGVYPPSVRDADGLVVAGIIVDGGSCQNTELWFSDGSFHRKIDHHLDLISEWKEPEVHEVWMNIYRPGHAGAMGFIYEHASKDSALSGAATLRVSGSASVTGPISEQASCTVGIRITDGVPEIVEYVNHVNGKE